jgi:hypothetical protein
LSSLPALRHTSTPAQPTIRDACSAPVVRDFDPPAPNSAGSFGRFVALLVAWSALFTLSIGAPIVMAINGAAPEAILAWMALVTAAVWSWFAAHRETRRPLPNPPLENFPASAAFHETWNTTETCAQETEEKIAATAWRRFWTASDVKDAQAAVSEAGPIVVVHEIFQPGRTNRGGVGSRGVGQAGGIITQPGLRQP